MELEPNSIQVGGAGIGAVNGYNISWSGLEQELAVLICEIADVLRIAPSVVEMKTTVKARVTSGTVAAIKKHTAEFTSTAFANLASAGVPELTKAVLR